MGMWWLREREATTPSLKREHTPTSPNLNGNHTSKTHEPQAKAPAAEPTEMPAPTPPVATAAGSPDPLTEINGIGPAFERALNEIGIFTYAQLAQQSAEALAASMDARGVTAERIERDEWIEQAQARVK